MGERSGEPPRQAPAESGAGSDGDAAVDISAVQADDALLDALGGADTATGDRLDGDELNALLLAWRQQADAEAMPELVDLDTAVATVRSAPAEPREAKRRLLVPVAAAAAVLVLGFGGVSIAAKSAQPGDALWGLTQVLYTDHARSVAAAAIVRTEFDTARLALSRGQISKARAALSSAGQALPTVSVEDGRAHLQATQQSLLARAGMPTAEDPTTTSRVTLTSVPPTTSPSVPVSPVPTGAPSSPPSASGEPPTTTSVSPPPPTSTAPTPGTSSPSSGSNGARTLSSTGTGKLPSDRAPSAPEPLTSTG